MTRPSPKGFYLLISLFLGVAALLILSRIPSSNIAAAPEPKGEAPPASLLPPAQPVGPWVELGGLAVPVEIAATDAARQKGLSGRPSLDSDSGMLFVFANPARYRFWMPDMHFPLDIIWIEAGKVVALHEHVSNEFDPAKPRFYSPPAPVRYVLEVNAGFARSHGIATGTPVVFHNIH